MDSIEARVGCETDARGLLSLDGAAPDLRGLHVEVSVTSPDGEDAVATIANLWKERCPIYLALIRPNTVDVTFRAA